MLGQAKFDRVLIQENEDSTWRPEEVVTMSERTGGGRDFGVAEFGTSVARGKPR